MQKISVITICFNNLTDLITTCASVDIQGIKPFEHLIIDGSVTPDIKSFLEGQPQPSYRKWICERDKGIADAFNKGIQNCRGDIIVMLNAGDTFFSESVIDIVEKAFDQNPGIEWLHAKYQTERGGKKVIIGKPFEKRKLYRGMRSISHQTMFVKKELHKKYGMYDLNEKIGMDYDFLCRISGERFLFLRDILINFAPGGTSSVNYYQSLKDTKRIYRKYFSRNLKISLWQIRLKFLHRLLHSPIGNFLYKIKAGLKLENL